VVTFASGCKSAVKVDVDCPSICISAPGPTLPGEATLAALSVDGGIDRASTNGLVLSWKETMNFNDVLAQLPSEALNTSVDVRLNAVQLSSTTDLNFTDSIRVFLSRQRKGSDAGSTTSDSIVSGGTSSETAPNGSSCRILGSNILVARYDRESDGPVGASIDLADLLPETNIFDCMKDAPVLFEVTMAFRPGFYPAIDAPLTLSTCIGAQGSYP
jgi:hypothetical protein